MLRMAGFLTLVVTLVAVYFGIIRSSGSPVQKPLAIPSPSFDSNVDVDPRKYFVRKIVAVGDLHGYMNTTMKVLQMANVVDHQGNWTGAVDFFVQTGDIIDRGDETIKLYLLMEKLRGQARAVGGDVLSLLGNHEWMNLLGDWRYVHQSEIKTFGSVAARQKMLTTGRIGRAWYQNYTVTTRLPLHSSLGPPNTDYDPEAAPSPLSHSALSFVHGGLSPTYQNLTPYPSKINEIGKTLHRRLLSKPFPPPHPPNPYHGLPADSTFEEKSLYDANGPLWYRGWANENEERVCSEVDSVLQKTGTRRLIMGHTPDFEKIVSRCDGKIIIIDTGISPAYGGTLSALSITYTLAPHDEDRWQEREVVVALYEDRQELLGMSERIIDGDF